MQVVTAIPISRGIHIEELTYFTAKKTLAPGMVVTVPLRGRSVPALVTSVSPVENAKALLKTADFSLRKLGPQKGTHLLSPAFIRAAKRTAEYHAASLGSVLFSTVPAHVFANAPDIASAAPFEDIQHALSADKTILVAETERRFDHYRNIIRESFARKRSVLIVVPSRLEAQTLYDAVHKGIAEYLFVFTGALSGKEFSRRFTAAMRHPHPVAIIGTPPSLAVPRNDISTIIIERESSGAYTDRSRPFVDYRMLAEFIAEERGGRIMFADLSVRAGTYARYERGDLAEIARVPKRLALPSRMEIVDMRQYKGQTPRDPFVIVSPELRRALEAELSLDGRAFVFSARRGLAPTTVCLDCGTTKTCERCDSPMVLHTSANGTIFACHTCGLAKSSEERCRHCTSWRLQSFGLGTERIAAELAKLFPDATVAILDADHAETERRAAAIAASFATGSRQLLVGTERAIPYLPKSLGVAGVAAIDTLLAIPEWNAYERMFGVLLRLREAAQSAVVVQTRRTEAALLADAAAGNLLSFYERELSDRKRFKYPPYSTLIRIDAVAGRGRSDALIAEAERILAPWGFIRTPRTVALPNSLYKSSGIVRTTNPWPDAALQGALRTLSPSLSIRIDPDSVV